MTTRLKRLFSQRSTTSPKKENEEATGTAAANGLTPNAHVTHNGKVIPSFDELPLFHDFKGCAWEVWGKDDELGTINLLTEEVVARAAREEIKSGKTVCLNWPIHFPSRPVFGRKVPEITTYKKYEDNIPVRDDVIHINTQSGSQWDGLKHYGMRDYNVFYNNTPAEALSEGQLEINDPSEIDYAKVKLGMHNWARHGIVGRGVLLDIVNFHTANGEELPYDPWTSHPITVADLETVAKKEGVKFRPGDILILRVGFMQKYYRVGLEEKHSLREGRHKETFAGIEQTDEMRRFLWNNHFAAVASDQPSMERWPAPEGTQALHQTFLGLWGMPIGEFFDVEALSETCKALGRYTFFFTSWPLHIIGGAASPPNAAAYF